MNPDTSSPVKKDLWQRLFSPHPSTEDVRIRRFASVLAGLLLVLLPLYFLWGKLSYDQVFSALWLMIGVVGVMVVSVFVQNYYLKRAKKETAQSKINEERFKYLFINSPVALLEMDLSALKRILDRGGKEQNLEKIIRLLRRGARVSSLRDVNSAALAFYETEDKEFLKKNWYQVVGEDEWVDFAKAIFKIWAGSVPVPVETTHKTFAEKHKNVIMRVSAEANHKDNTWERIIFSITDITQQRKSQEQIDKLLKEQIAVRNAMEVLTSTLDINTVLENLAKEMGNLINATSVYIREWSANKKKSTVVAEYFNKDIINCEHFSKLGESYAEGNTEYNEILSNNRHIVSYSEDPILSKEYRQFMQRSGLKTILFVPIQVQGEVIAFAEILERRGRRDFTPEEIVICQHISQNAAIAINNARNYQRAQEEIQHRKEIENELRKLSNATEQSASGVVITNVEGSIEYVNPAFTAITGYSPEEAIGEKVGEMLYSGEHDEQFYDQLAKSIAHGEIWKGEIINRRKDGNLYWESLIISPIKDENGEITHRAEVKEDITRRKELEQALVLAHEEALVASDMKTQLLANVSHDMRTPLGSILGYTEMLEVGVFEPLNDKQAEVTRAIASSSQKLLNFVSDLLNQAQIDTGEIVLNKSLFKPQQLLDGIGGEMSLARTQGLNLNVTFDEKMPKEIVGDPYWLGQILHNLFSNAIKFTPRGGEISIRLLKSGEYAWILEVADTGRGIPLEAQGYIFESFRQVDGSITREAHTGSGLGLSIVNHLVRLMRGEIRLESKVNKGSTFTILLPLLEKKESEHSDIRHQT